MIFTFYTNRVNYFCKWALHLCKCVLGKHRWWQTMWSFNYSSITYCTSASAPFGPDDLYSLSVFFCNGFKYGIESQLLSVFVMVMLVGLLKHGVHLFAALTPIFNWLLFKNFQIHILRSCVFLYIIFCLKGTSEFSTLHMNVHCMVGPYVTP